MHASWHLLSGEYPPDPGGVSDYTYNLAHALADAGDAVHVWAPRRLERSAEPRVRVHEVSGGFSVSGLRRLSAGLDGSPGPRRLLVQYVPHALGYRGMNIAFASWLAERGQVDEVWVMFHEVSFPWNAGAPAAHRILSMATWLMAGMVARAAVRTFVSAPAWTQRLRELVPSLPSPILLPIPSSLPTEASAQQVRALRAQLQVPGDAALLGHFGTYGEAIGSVLGSLLPTLLAVPQRHVLLIGRGGDAWRAHFLRSHPLLSGRVHALGLQNPASTAAAIDACDLMIQPFPDGITSRRSSLMASLALGKAVVSNGGELSEPLWASAPVWLAESFTAPHFLHAVNGLLEQPAQRERLEREAASFYETHFSLERTVRTLRADLP